LRLYNSALSLDEVTPDTTPPETPTGFESVFEAEQTPTENEFEELELTEGEEGDTTISWNAAVDPPFPNEHPGSGVSSYTYRYRHSGGAWTSWATTAVTAIVVGSTTESESFEVEVTAVDQAGNTSSVGSATLEGTPTELSAENYGEEEAGESGSAPLEPEELEGEEEHLEEEEQARYGRIPDETQLAAFHPELAPTSGEAEVIFANDLQERLCGEYPTTNPCGRYNGHDAAKYATEWDLAGTDNDEARRDANHRFEYYGGNGGDCTNFASQALKAGGMKFMRATGENDTNASTGSQAGNFHRGVGSWWTYYQTTPVSGTSFLQTTFESSESFIKAPKLYEHLSGFGLISSVDRLARPRPGDLVFYNLAGSDLSGIDHTQVVVRVTKKAIWVAQHSPGYVHTMAYVVNKNDKPGHELGIDWNFWFVHPIYTAANIGTEPV
jgi:hypothetical protein